MHELLWRPCSLVMFLMLVSVKCQFTNEIPNLNLPSSNETTQNGETGLGIDGYGTPSMTQDGQTVRRNVIHLGSLEGPEPVTDKEEEKSQPNLIYFPSTQEHMDPLDLYSSRDCGGGSCVKRCGENSGRSPVSEDLEETCSCKAGCIIFGDCCFDFFSLCLDTNLTSMLTNVHSIQDVGKMIYKLHEDETTLTEKVSMYLFKSCNYVYSQFGKSYIFMVSDCPRNEDPSKDDNVSKCRNELFDPLGNVPASLKYQDDIVFKNVYCAVCNGIERGKVQLWNTTAFCPDVDTSSLGYTEILTLLKTSQCKIRSVVPTEARRCNQQLNEVIESCPVYDATGERFRSTGLQCRSYLYPVITGSDGKIRNWHCGMCSVHESHEDIRYKCIQKNKPFNFYNASMPRCEEMSCVGICGKRQTLSKCQCDQDCLLYGDCCYDYIPVCLDKDYTLTDVIRNQTLFSELMDKISTHNTGNSRSQVNQRLGQEEVSLTQEERNHLRMVFFQYRTCTEIVGRKVNMVWTIGKCPKDKEDPRCTSVGNKTNRDLVSPASHKDDSNIVFKNKYCGLCHGILPENLIQWNSIIYCEEPIRSFKSEQALLQEKICKIQVQLKASRNCLRDSDVWKVSSPAGDNPMSVILCQAYRYTVYEESGYVLRNPHCDFTSNKTLLCSPDSTSDQLGSGRLEKSEAANVAGLSILFNFNENGVHFVSRGGTAISHVTCKTDELYDHIRDVCTTLYCQQGKIAINGSCIRNGTWFAEERNMIFVNGSQEFIINSYLLADKPLTVNGAERIIQTILSNEDIDTDDNLLEMKDVIVVNNSDVPEYVSSDKMMTLDSKEDIQLLQVTTGRRGSFRRHFSAVTTFIRKLTNMNQYLHYILDVTVQNFRKESDLTCSFGDVMEVENPSLVTINEIPYANESDSLYPLDNVAFVWGILDNTPLLHEVYVCSIPLECDPVVSNLTDFTFEGDSLKSIHSNLILSNDSFHVSGQQVFFCHNFTQSPSKNSTNIFFVFDPVQDILTYVTSGISLASLLVTVCVYILLPELRNLPGRLTMSLSLSLILAQTLLLLIHVPTGVLCQALAISLHFFWICSFMWMTAMSFNMARTFTNKMKGSPHSSIAASHAKFSVLAFGFPLVIVTVSAVLDYLDMPGIEIGYGKQDICWITNPRASLLIFGVPLALIIVINLIAFILTFYNIEMSMRASKDITSTRGDRYKVIIYGKLFVIMGLTWSFSFAAAFANTPVLWYAFIILNGLQGFYIFVSFICTDRVMRLLKKKVVSRDYEKSKTTQTITSMSKI